ncbi:MAG: hypothetical protein M5U28_28085 [Sandaracinaceae bacterium]|nr:hypothetical protein [Sandaracinaceae bacterium]
MYRVGEVVAGGLPSKELDRALGIEELEDDREVVLQELVVEDGGAPSPADRRGFVARELREKPRTAERERVRAGPGCAGEFSDVAVTDEPLEDRTEGVDGLTDERAELVHREVLALGEGTEELREPRRLWG